MIKKILITGGAGFIGLNLANKLARIGYEVVIADNFERAVQDKFLKESLSRDNITLINLNLLDETETMSLDKDFHAVFH